MPTPTTSATDRLPSIQQEEQEPNKMEDDSSCVMSEGQVEQVARANQESAAEEERKNLARSEDTAVSWLRVLVLGLLLLTAVLVCFGVYWFTRQDEKEDFEKEFTSSAAKLVETFHESVERRLGACDTLSVTITSYAMQTGATFPNVTMPNWALRGMNSRIMADSPLIYWLPLVTDEMRPGWEAFAAQNHHHL